MSTRTRHAAGSAPSSSGRRRSAQGNPITRIGGAADQLTLAETLRRLGRFEEARDCCHRGLSGRPADPIRSVLEFEIELLSAEDTESHAVAEVLNRGL